MDRSGTATNPDITATLHRAADASGQAIMPYFRARTAIENKSPTIYDPVTAADREAELAIRRIIADHFPDHGIIGEEFGRERADADMQWVIDPIDGTRAFIQGLPTWGTIIGVTEAGRPRLGMMNQPFTRERYWSDGTQAFYRGPDGDTVQLKTSGSQLSQLQMSTTDPGLFVEPYEAAAYGRLRAAARTCRYGADCYAYCLLAAGHIDVVLESGLHVYDIAGLIPIVEHAGGVVSTWDGGSPDQGGRILACGDPQVHREIVALLNAG